MSQQYFVIDNGSYNIKAGFNSQNSPIKHQNTLSKARDGLIYVGNEYLVQTNNYSGMIFKRPYDHGHLISWETEKAVWDYTFNKASPNQELDTSITHLTLTETPFQLPQLSMNTDQIVFEEYGFNEYYRCAPASLVPWGNLGSSENSNNDFTLVVDSGYSGTWIVPIIYQNVYWKGVKKLPIGGASLNGLLREIISFRHYDIADEPVLINTIKEKTCFMATDFEKSLANRKKYKCEFILPDFKTTTTGFVRTKDTPVDTTGDVQSLALIDERFTIPESFYHPEIIFDNTTSSTSTIQNASFKNITDLVVESIMTCPKVTQPLLLGNIITVGGNTNLSGFTDRLRNELVKELPIDWHVKVKETEHNPDEASWYGGAQLTNDEIIKKISISKKDYFEHGSNWCQKQFGFKNL
ncbi:Actin-like protein ARP6 [Debaryomyces fabryi]|uniref:Actin-like protein ARP6 n=1 Tax=Debaryomyces fabryi TaxID=58627 RepID=A0A0V1Q0H0_9ASCO|nr:Actin-like protein ARP6 [Debaryomyces fabryi]KSA01866.1 Actin-like protein ARP6 [Debaryomyces fabryi]CUM45622.1 unnamed protein product [Debaryomyces fabryi]